MRLPVLVLNSQADRRLKLGHLWIYSNEVDTAKSPLKSFSMGQQALVTTNSGKPLGVAVINPNGLICGRLVSRDEKYPLNKSLLVHRIKQSLALRELAFDEPFYRLIYGDADLLPGLVVDRFGELVDLFLKLHADLSERFGIYGDALHFHAHQNRQQRSFDLVEDFFLTGFGQQAA